MRSSASVLNLTNRGDAVNRSENVNSRRVIAGPRFSVNS